MAARKPIVVYGAGGLAREFEWWIRRINDASPTWQFEGYVVTDKTKLGEHDSQDAVVGDEAWLLQQRGLSVVLAIGTPEARCTVGARLTERLPPEAFPVLLDPTVIYDTKTSHLDAGTVITARSMLSVNVHVKRFAFINAFCTVGHESIIGVGCVLNPAVNVSGGVSIGDGTLVGTGAQVMQYINIGERSVVGAGALVTKDVAAGATVVGVPARPRM